MIMTGYSRPDLVEWVMNKCVIVPASSEKLMEMVNWCKENCKERRPHHPLYEAQEGWIDFFDGDWCYTNDGRVDPLEISTYNFWFWNDSDRVEFVLRFT